LAGTENRRPMRRIPRNITAILGFVKGEFLRPVARNNRADYSKPPPLARETKTAILAAHHRTTA